MVLPKHPRAQVLLREMTPDDTKWIHLRESYDLANDLTHDEAEEFADWFSTWLAAQPIAWKTSANWKWQSRAKPPVRGLSEPPRQIADSVESGKLL